MWGPIQKILDKRSISIYQLARLTAINENTLYSYSRGISEPSFRNMCKVAKVLRISLDKLYLERG